MADWKDVKVVLNGVELQITSVTWNQPGRSLLELQIDLQNAEIAEDYLLCAEIKKKIDNYNKL